MLLLIDAGNSRIKWNLLTPDAAAFHGKTRSCAWEKLRLPNYFDDQWRNLKGITRVLVSNVAGKEFVEILKHWVFEHWYISVETVSTSESSFGVTCGYSKPAQLGVDRWVGLVAARFLVPKAPVSVMDCGTALTIDTLSRSGIHMGGMIVPGIDLMRQSLVENTRGITAQAMKTKITLFGKDTQSGVNSGAVYAIVSTMDRVAEEINKRCRGKAQCILTGGYAPFIQPLLRGPYQYEPDLILIGLGRMAGSF